MRRAGGAAARRGLHRLARPPNESQALESEKTRITLYGLASNVALSGLKLSVGSSVGSAALIADGVHSVTDGLSDLVALWSLHLAKRPADARHPFGWGHFETIGSLTLGASLLGAGAVSLGVSCVSLHATLAPPGPAEDAGSRVSSLLLKQDSDRMLASQEHRDVTEIFGGGASSNPPGFTDELLSWLKASPFSGEPAVPYEGVPVDLLPAALGATVLAIAVKETLFRVSYRIGVESKSPVMIANALHHRADSLTSIVAGLGLAGTSLGYPVLDPIGGLVVSATILYSGGQVIHEAVGDLTDRHTEASEETVEKIKKLSHDLSFSTELRSVHDVRVRRIGSARVVDLHAVVDPSLSVTASYHTGQRLRRVILDECKDINDVFVHVDAGEHAFVGEDIDDASSLLERPPPPSHYDVEEQVKRVVRDLTREDLGSRVPRLMGVDHVQVHFFFDENGGTTSGTPDIGVELDLIFDDDDSLTMGEMTREGLVVKQELLRRVEGLKHADVHVQLRDDGQIMDFRTARRTSKLVNQ